MQKTVGITCGATGERFEFRYRVTRNCAAVEVEIEDDGRMSAAERKLWEELLAKHEQKR